MTNPNDAAGSSAAGPRRTRMRADERRAQLVAVAARHFAATSYGRATMADIAAAAGVTAALAYRHFPSKAALFAGCMQHEWEQLRAAWDEVLAADAPPEEHLLRLANAFVDADGEVATIISLWFQAITEAPGEPILREAYTHAIDELHAYVEAVASRSFPAVGGQTTARIPRVEAWIFLGIGMLVAADMRTGKTMLADLPDINRERVKWIYGDAIRERIFGPSIP